MGVGWAGVVVGVGESIKLGVFSPFGRLVDPGVGVAVGAVMIGNWVAPHWVIAELRKRSQVIELLSDFFFLSDGESFRFRCADFRLSRTVLLSCGRSFTRPA